NVGSDTLVVTYTPPPDLSAPVVESRSPAPGAVNVMSSASISATFNEPVDPATINTSTFELRNAANDLVPVTVTYDASTRTARLTPTGPLAPYATYTAILKGGTTDP